MPPLQWERRPEVLRAPALICAFSGWNDAADAATTAVDQLVHALGAQRFARIDGEEYFDFQATRPQLRAVDECRRRVVWPEIAIHAARLPGERRDLILLTGPEPSMRWRSFSEAVIELAETLGVQLAVTLGAVLADVPHSRPVVITGLMTDEEIADRVGVAPTQYEGPTGIVGVLHTAFDEAGIPAASIWAAVPHYVAATTNPRAALVLLRKTARVVRVPFDLSLLEEEAAQYQQRLDFMVDTDAELREMVERLEQGSAIADVPLLDPSELPSGDSIAQEFQRFLRRHGADGPDA